MKAFILALAVAAIAASPAAAATKKKMKRVAAAPAAATSPMANNENSARFVRDSLPVFLPSWSIPAYMSVSGRTQ